MNIQVYWNLVNILNIYYFELSGDTDYHSLTPVPFKVYFGAIFFAKNNVLLSGAIYGNTTLKPFGLQPKPIRFLSSRFFSLSLMIYRMHCLLIVL